MEGSAGRARGDSDAAAIAGAGATAGEGAGAALGGVPGYAPSHSVAGHSLGGAQAAAGSDLARAVTAQVAASVAAEPGSARIELRLDPPELGRLEISLDIVDQTLRATVAAERSGTHDLLRCHADLLLAQLQQAGFSGIDLRFAGEQRHAPGSGRAPAGEPAARPDPNAPEGPPDAGHEAVSWRLRADGLDLRF